MPTPSSDCPATIDDLFPPNLSYRYFSLARQFPFNYPARDFQPVNAWWLAEASLLAYADEPYASRQYQRVAIQVAPPLKAGRIFCHVAYTNDFAIVAFRGTQVLMEGAGMSLEDVIRDWAVDGDISLGSWSAGGAVHNGFKQALEEVWNDRQGREGLKSCLDRIAGRPPRKAVWFTGHSLGAALATLAAQRYGSAAGVYTFGSPCVGDEAFARGFRLPAYRIVNAADIVTQALKAGPYGSDGQARSGAIGRYQHVGVLRRVKRSCPPVKQLGILQRLLDDLGIAVLDPFVDHAPLYYALYTRNALGG